MKLIYLILFLTSVVVQSQARENPFIATSAYEEEKQRILETEQDYAYEFQEKNTPKEVEIKKVVIEEKPKVKILKKEVVVDTRNEESKIKKLIKSIKQQLPEENNNVESTEIIEDKITVEPEIINEVPIEEVVSKEIFNPTPFIKIINYSNRIEIYTKYSVFKKFNLNDENKIVLDYHAKVSFYTKKIDLNSNYFNKIIVGNHKKEKYFRIVVKTTNHPASYKVTHKDDMVIIYKGE